MAESSARSNVSFMEGNGAVSGFAISTKVRYFYRGVPFRASRPICILVIADSVYGGEPLLASRSPYILVEWRDHRLEGRRHESRFGRFIHRHPP
jgi:hypothetical protein